MPNTLQFKRQYLAIGIPLFFILAIIIFSQSIYFKTNIDALALGVSIDLLITIPLVYFLLIRKTAIPKASAISLIVLGIAIGTRILPNNLYYIDLFKTFAFPVIELAVFSYIFYQVNKTLKKFKKNKEVSVDFYSALKSTCSEILPKFLVSPVVAELALYYYGFFHWKKIILKQNEFSYHKKNKVSFWATYATIAVVIETIILHFFLSKWNETLAWIATCLSIYMLVQIIGFAKSIMKRPISIDNATLNLYYGVLGEVKIDIIDIVSVELATDSLHADEGLIQISPLEKILKPNVIISVKKEYTLIRYFGIKNKFTSIGLNLDTADVFVKLLNAKKELL